MTVTNNTSTNFNHLPPSTVNDLKLDHFIHQTGKQAITYGFTSNKAAELACEAFAKLSGNPHLPNKATIKKGNIIANLTKAVLYLPIIGQIVAIMGLILLTKGEKAIIEKGVNAKNVHKFTSHLKARLILSAIGLGFIYSVPDAIFSGIYHHRTNKLAKDLEAYQKSLSPNSGRI